MPELSIEFEFFILYSNLLRLYIKSVVSFNLLVFALGLATQKHKLKLERGLKLGGGWPMVCISGKQALRRQHKKDIEDSHSRGLQRCGIPVN